jgi:hypothetical protein
MSGGSDSAANAAQQQQAQQQAAIQQGTNEVQSIFSNPARTAQYQQLADATTQYYTNQLNQQQTLANNQLTFTLAQNGQIGGSVQADQQATLGKEYDQGVLQATQMGQQAEANLEASDTQEQANLIAAVQGGESATQAATQAAEAMQSGLSTAQANSETQALGNVFGNVSTMYQNSQAAAAARNGYLYGYGSVYSPGFGAGGGTSTGSGGSAYGGF